MNYVDPSGHAKKAFNNGQYYPAAAWDTVRHYQYPDTPLYNRNKKIISNIKCNKKFKKELKKFKKVYKKNKKTYKKIANKTKIPPQLIAAIHYRESTCDFNAYYHNGDPLGKPTVHVPIGKNFDNFIDSAIDALKGYKSFRKKYKLKKTSKDIVAMVSFAEVYNGLGYYNNGHISPYIYSGTSAYKSGKYASDSKYDPNLVDKQPGIYVLIKKIIKIK